MAEPHGQELINLYKKNYQIANDLEVTEEMILSHWKLEQSLTQKLLQSTSETRWNVFETCYSELYRELSWLNKLIDSNTSITEDYFQIWSDLISPAPKKIYEIGSGKGSLISFLATKGYVCCGSEITTERGKKFTTDNPNLRWAISDGIHLDDFELKNEYDVIISNQVIEHMHPDDIIDHFKGAYSILNDKGRYILSTPHSYAGPSDISRVFKCDSPKGMHLKEYTYQELENIVKGAGFKNVRAIFYLPSKLKFYVKPIPLKNYFRYLLFLEKVISPIKRKYLRRKVASYLKILLFCPNIFLVLDK